MFLVDIDTLRAPPDGTCQKKPHLSRDLSVASVILRAPLRLKSRLRPVVWCGVGFVRVVFFVFAISNVLDGERQRTECEWTRTGPAYFLIFGERALGVQERGGDLVYPGGSASRPLGGRRRGAACPADNTRAREPRGGAAGGRAQAVPSVCVFVCGTHATRAQHGKARIARRLFVANAAAATAATFVIDCRRTRGHRLRATAWCSSQWAFQR